MMGKTNIECKNERRVNLKFERGAKYVLKVKFGARKCEISTWLKICVRGS